MNLHIYPNAHDLSYAVANKIFAIYDTAIKEKNFFTICFSGGSSSINLYKILAQSNFAKKINWKKFFVFWGDERCLPIDSKESNAGNAFHALLDHVPIPIDNIHTIPGMLAPELAAEKYEKKISNFFGLQPPRFDLVLLGMGTDGHTASLFPNHPVLKEKSHWVREVKNTNDPFDRITLTPVIFNKARNIIFLVYGEDKQKALNKVIHGDYNPEKYPAQLIHTNQGNLCWYLDEQAAALLPKEKQ